MTNVERLRGAGALLGRAVAALRSGDNAAAGAELGRVAMVLLDAADELEAIGKISGAFGDPALRGEYIHDGLYAKRVQDAAVLWQLAGKPRAPLSSLRGLRITCDTENSPPRWAYIANELDEQVLFYGSEDAYHAAVAKTTEVTP